MGGPGHVMRTIARDVPDYVWMTSFDIMIVVELSHPDITPACIVQTLNKLHRTGRVIRRPVEPHAALRYRSPMDHSAWSAMKYLYLVKF